MTEADVGFTDNNPNFEEQKFRKYELQNIIRGIGEKTKGDIIQATARYLRGSKEAGRAAKGNEYSKEQETKDLIAFIDKNNLWYKKTVSTDDKIGEGAEQKVYFYPEKQKVVKLNDSIFFASWLDYINNLSIHNYFFPGTFYTLLGFLIVNDTLYSVVEQPYVKSTEGVKINEVKDFLKANGFENTRRNDYYNPHLGIILEDLHDENVISSRNQLFFVDTVFYLTDKFY